MLDKHLPLDAAADIIGELGLNGGQIRHTNKTMQRIVRNAWNRLPAARRPSTFDEFADTVPAHHWALMFEVCALSGLGRTNEACALISTARRLRTIHSDCAR
ncbi:hypothetical protein [Streptomyces alanosinicus]|uniref:Uncharacterized protein n=1 Tax=Streptomyces alanosinicus TaxID=68171 RepID=A0A918YMD5_9ACTN|nr:hypothetical protein [Streptomyces alanosinicus]GHE09201.1 hypothetical protein GCM10010339_60660 [Streptomyces alanosinicus]